MGEVKRKFKTKRELTASVVYRGYKEWAVGDIVIGEIVDFRKDDYGGMGVVINVLDCQFSKDKKKFEGKKLYLNSCAIIKKSIDDLKAGMILQVEYLGVGVTQKGKFAGKDFHEVDLKVVEDDDGSVDADTLNHEDEESDL
jgi:hypothetical protein